MYTIQYAHYAPCAPYTLHITLHIMHYIHHAHYALYTMYTIHYIHYTVYTLYGIYTVYYVHCALHRPCALYTMYSSVSLLVYTFILISHIVYGVLNTKATSPYRRSSRSCLTKEILPQHRNTNRYDIKQMRISILHGSLIYVRIFVISDAYKFSIYSIYCP